MRKCYQSTFFFFYSKMNIFQKNRILFLNILYCNIIVSHYVYKKCLYIEKVGIFFTELSQKYANVTGCVTGCDELNFFFLAIYSHCDECDELTSIYFFLYFFFCMCNYIIRLTSFENLLIFYT